MLSVPICVYCRITVHLSVPYPFYARTHTHCAGVDGYLFVISTVCQFSIGGGVGVMLVFDPCVVLCFVVLCFVVLCCIVLCCVV